MSKTGDTALWPGDGVAKSVATRAPPWTVKTAVCPRRSPTAPARLWRHYGNRVTDLVHRESDEFPRQGRWSWPHWGSELSYLLALLLIDDWGWWKQGAKQACIKSPFKFSLREQSSCPPMSDSRSQKGLFCPRHFNSLTVCWLLLETYQGRFWSDVTKSRPLAPWGISLWPWWIVVPRNMELSVIFKLFSLKLRHKPLRVQISPAIHIELLSYILFEQVV